MARKTKIDPAIIKAVEFIPTGTPEVHVVAPMLARGAEGKASTHCRKSLSDQKAARPKAEPEVTTAKVRKAVKKATPKAKAPKAATGRKLILKANKEVRSLLTKAAQAAGGTRLTPIGFDSYSHFLNGIHLTKDGDATIVLIPVKGNEPIRGKNVKLNIRGGKVHNVK